ncbi:hypothetical protein F-LCD7_0282 [Faustovirus]|nr:hypothetical protein F-LCD7_0282 [Faustovirus]QJX73039.1 hypothetical protein F-VV57_0278 [Faustovirus]QJX73546.1 hypothetical protein F-VV63_0280 [Faustovirus]
MQYINFDIAVEISAYLSALRDIWAFMLTSRMFNQAISHNTMLAQTQSITTTRICPITARIGHCGSNNKGTHHACYIKHNITTISIDELNIRCTLGQFLTEILPFTRTSISYNCSYAAIKLYTCITCQCVYPVNLIVATINRSILTFDGATVKVQGVYECVKCKDSDTVGNMLTYAARLPPNSICVAIKSQPNGDNLALFKQFKKYYYVNRRKKYKFIFV